MAWVERSGADAWRVRYRRDNGTIGSVPGFPSEEAAQDYIDDMASDKRRGRWIDPASGRVKIGERADEWLANQDVLPRTADNLRSRMRNHILPRWANTAFENLNNAARSSWRNDLLASGLARVTANDIVKTFTTMINDIIYDHKVLPASPFRPRRRGRRRTTGGRRKKRVWAEPVDLLRFADQVAEYYHPSGGVLIVTAGWAGERWGELTGLQRPNLHLSDGGDSLVAVVHDPQRGRGRGIDRRKPVPATADQHR